MKINLNPSSLVKAIEELKRFVGKLKPASPPPDLAPDDRPVLADSDIQVFLRLDQRVHALATAIGQKLLEPNLPALGNDWFGHPIRPAKRLGYTQLQITWSKRIDVEEWAKRLDALSAVAALLSDESSGKKSKRRRPRSPRTLKIIQCFQLGMTNRQAIADAASDGCGVNAVSAVRRRYPEECKPP